MNEDEYDAPAWVRIDVFDPIAVQKAEDANAALCRAEVLEQMIENGFPAEYVDEGLRQIEQIARTMHRKAMASARAHLAH